MPPADGVLSHVRSAISVAPAVLAPGGADDHDELTEHCGDVALPVKGLLGRTLAGRPSGGLGGDVDRALRNSPNVAAFSVHAFNAA